LKTKFFLAARGGFFTKRSVYKAFLELEEASFRFNFSFGIIIAISFFLTVCLFSILLPDLPPPKWHILVSSANIQWETDKLQFLF
jgi:hypothetical protein